MLRPVLLAVLVCGCVKPQPQGRPIGDVLDPAPGRLVLMVDPDAPGDREALLARTVEVEKQRLDAAGLACTPVAVAGMVRIDCPGYSIDQLAVVRALATPRGHFDVVLVDPAVERTTALGKHAAHDDE